MALERRRVWQCIGCGRIEDPRPCVGICRDEKAEYVLAAEHDRAIAGLLETVRTLARTTPREGECMRLWRALQELARAAIAALGE